MTASPPGVLWYLLGHRPGVLWYLLGHHPGVLRYLLGHHLSRSPSSPACCTRSYYTMGSSSVHVIRELFWDLSGRKVQYHR